ncbi:MAG TPA: trehalose-6-phosphate synthase, partial [Burkholderiaceae bacterium]|nr:trehalose-6-phosphate synthase [Burkholderiaceae bacterium]
YRELAARTSQIVSRINARFADGDYRPNIWLEAHHEPEDIFQFFRAASICYVGSLHDGMNLVAKEYVAARDDERGVLVLSQFAGAARELHEALIVNPYHIEEVAEAMHRALAMPAEEQRERMLSLRQLVREFNVYRWAGRMLMEAARLRQRERISARIGESQGVT